MTFGEIKERIELGETIRIPAFVWWSMCRHLHDNPGDQSLDWSISIKHGFATIVRNSHVAPDPVRYDGIGSTAEQIAWANDDPDVMGS